MEFKKIVLVAGFGGHDFQLPLQIDQALAESRHSKVVYLFCDVPHSRCFENPFGIKSICDFCIHSHKNIVSKYRGAFDVIYMSSILNFEELIFPNFEEYDFTRIDIIKQIDHLNFKIGLGAISSYVSLTRDIGPFLSISSQNLIRRFLVAQVFLIEILSRLKKIYKIKKIIVHNGRFSHYKPFVEYARSYKLDYLITESRIDVKSGIILKDNYFCSSPHDYNILNQRITKYWNESRLDFDTKIALGQSFFQRKLSNLFVGDNMYNPTVSVPFDFDPSCENIVIFTSSEDEFFSVEFKENAEIFRSQFEAIKYILDKFVNFKGVHVWLRIHPNLKNVNHSHHLALLQFDHSNLTIVPAWSKISSYDLLNIASKVFVYDSTIGIEAVYQGKPTCALSTNYTFRDLNVVYVPVDIGSLDTWISSTGNLMSDETRLNLCKYGFYIMYSNPDLRPPVIWQKKQNILFTRKLILFQEEKYLGSSILFYIIKKIILRYTNWRLGNLKSVDLKNKFNSRK
jgi:hypothetical protein